MPSWFDFPPIPHWESPFVPCPNKIVLSDAASALSIKRGRTPVRGVAAQVLPFVIVAKLSVPNHVLRRFSADVSFCLRVEFSELFPVETIFRDDRSANRGSACGKRVNGWGQNGANRPKLGFAPPEPERLGVGSTSSSASERVHGEKSRFHRFGSVERP